MHSSSHLLLRQRLALRHNAQRCSISPEQNTTLCHGLVTQTDGTFWERPRLWAGIVSMTPSTLDTEEVVKIVTCHLLRITAFEMEEVGEMGWR